MTDLTLPGWSSHGYAVWSGAAAGALGVWVAWRGVRAWPGAAWRRLRGVACVPGELTRSHLWLLAGLALALVGAAAIGVEWGLRGFQSYREPALAGRLDLQVNPERVLAVWNDGAGRATGFWSPPCARILLEGEFVEWSRAARAAGFRDRHRVAAGRLSCDPESTAHGAGAPLRLRPPSPTWERLRRWDRYLPVLRTERRESPALRVESRSWRVFVMPAGYAFAE